MAPASAPLLTVDLGNTRAKLRWWGALDGGSPLAALDLMAGDAGSAELARALARWRPARVALSSVASPATTGAWRARLTEAAGAPLEEPLGIANRCRSPERVGRDRLFAALGAVRLTGRSCLVVDAGTALTVDAVTTSSGEAGPPSFLGGSIAPGPDLLAAALAGGTANLPRVAPRPGVPALGRVTEEALESGITVGFRGAAAELARAVAREADLVGAPVVVTGGWRGLLLEPSACLPEPLVVAPELVHLGLLAALETERGAR